MSASRRMVFSVALSWLATVVAGTAACQDTSAVRGPTKRRVLAEAASTLPPGNFYLVNARAYPFRVVGAYSTPDSAAQMAGAVPGRYEVSGPVRGSGSRTPWSVVSVTVRIRGVDGRVQTLEYDPRGVDAVFLSVPAVDKFMVPYYTSLYGRSFADSLRAVVIGGEIPKPPCHRYSFPCAEIP